MGIIAFDPTIPVFDRFAKSFPEHVEGEPATYGPFSEAAATEFGWDAHFAAYSQPAVARRLAKEGALAHAPKMVLLVLDVDGPDHRCAPEWWALEREKVRAFFKARGRGYAYTTKGGYRVVMGLRDELVLRTRQDALRWRHSYLDWIAKIQQEFQISCDPQCADWTRCFRLPRVKRDSGEWHHTPGFDEIGEADRMLEWREPYIAEDDPRLQYADVSYEVSEPAPVPGETESEREDSLAAAATALGDAWPKRNRHYAGLALAGALAKAGWSEGAVAEFLAAVFWQANGGDPWHDEARASARTSCEKAARGEPLAGWDSLVGYLCTTPSGQVDDSLRPAVEEKVLGARRRLGQGPAIDLFQVVTQRATIREQLAAARAADDPLVRNLPTAARFGELLDDAATLITPAFEVARKENARKRDAAEVKPMFSTMREVIGRDLPSPEFLVDNLVLADGVGALSGEPKSGKSWDLMHMCVAVAAQKPVFGRFAVQRPVGAAYFSVEDTEAAVKTRVLAIARSMGLDLAGDWTDRLAIQARGRELDVCSEFDMSVFLASIWWLEEQTGVRRRLVGMDPLSDIHGKKEDSRDDMAVVMAHFRAVQKILSHHATEPVAIVFVHHSGKESADTKGRKRGGQKMRGSSAVHGAVDFGIYVMSPEGDKKTTFIGTVESEVKAARGGGLFVRKIEIEDDASGKHAVKATWTTSEATEKDAPPDLVNQRAVDVTGALFRQNAPLTRDAIKRKIGGKTDIALRAIDVAEENGWIVQLRNGGASLGYEITEKGRDLIRGGGRDGGGEEGEPQAPPAPPGGMSGFLASYTSTNT